MLTPTRSNPRSPNHNLFSSLAKTPPVPSSPLAVSTPTNSQLPPSATPTTAISNIRFTESDLVLCKYSTYPLWPAKISRTHQRRYQGKFSQYIRTKSGDEVLSYWCIFSGEQQGGWVRATHLLHYHPTLVDLVSVSDTSPLYTQQQHAFAAILEHYITLRHQNKLSPHYLQSPLNPDKLLSDFAEATKDSDDLSSECLTIPDSEPSSNDDESQEFVYSPVNPRTRPRLPRNSLHDHSLDLQHHEQPQTHHHHHHLESDSDHEEPEDEYHQLDPNHQPYRHRHNLRPIRPINPPPRRRRGSDRSADSVSRPALSLSRQRRPIVKPEPTDDLTYTPPTPSQHGRPPRKSRLTTKKSPRLLGSPPAEEDLQPLVNTKPVRRKRGRPRKNEARPSPQEEHAQLPRQRKQQGRLRKYAVPAPHSSNNLLEVEQHYGKDSADAPVLQRRRIGRPAKKMEPVSYVPPRRRGRRVKEPEPRRVKLEVVQQLSRRKRGRPPKSPQPESEHGPEIEPEVERLQDEQAQEETTLDNEDIAIAEGGPMTEDTDDEDDDEPLVNLCARRKSRNVVRAQIKPEPLQVDEPSHTQQTPELPSAIEPESLPEHATEQVPAMKAQMEAALSHHDERSGGDMQQSCGSERNHARMPRSRIPTFSQWARMSDPNSFRESAQRLDAKLSSFRRRVFDYANLMERTQQARSLAEEEYAGLRNEAMDTEDKLIEFEDALGMLTDATRNLRYRSIPRKSL